MNTQRAVTLELAASADAPSLARDAVADALRTDYPKAVPTASLVVSELVSNAVIHGGTGTDARLTLTVSVHDATLRLVVHDSGGGFSLPLPDHRGPGGFGLGIVDMVSDRWGVDPGPPTTVWCELSLD